MMDHHAEYVARWIDPIDTIIAQLAMVVEGGYAGKKTRRAKMFKLISDFWNNKESEDVQEARALIHTITQLRKRGRMVDEDADKVLEAARKLIEDTGVNG